MWRHLAPHDAPRPWQSRAMVGRVGFKMGGSNGVNPGVMVHGIGGLMASCLCVGLVACVQGRAGLP